MTKVKRGNYIFKKRLGDHRPVHVHVYRDGCQILKFDLENRKPIKGRLSRRILRLINELENEGLL